MKKLNNVIRVLKMRKDAKRILKETLKMKEQVLEHEEESKKYGIDSTSILKQIENVLMLCQEQLSNERLLEAIKG